MATVPTPIEDGWSSCGEPIRDAGLRADVAILVGRIAEALGTDIAADPTDDLGAARDRLDASAVALTRALRDGGSGPAGLARDVAVDLLLDVRDVMARLSEAREAERLAAFGRVREAMGLLRGVTGVDRLLERAPIAAARLGFDRTIVSSIEDSYFVPRTSFMGGDDEWAAAVVRAGRDAPRRLDRTLLETEMVRRRQPISVPDAQNDPRVHAEIAAVSMSRSYVAAPVIAQDRVVGFVHGDCFDQRRIVGRPDAEVLWMFAEAFGFAFERIAYGERIATLRTSFMDAMSAAGEDLARLDDELSLGVPPSGPAPVSPDASRPRTSAPAPAVGSGRPELQHLLTRRELEVLRLLATGATNDGIASRLVISHGTAKTHVKHILRKLGAANRAEAVSRWFQLEQRPDRPAR